MIEAVKTTASPAEIWAIVVVAVSCLAFWLGVVAWADLHPLWRGKNVPEMPGPVLGGMHLGSGGRSVAPNREAPSVLTNVDEEPYDERDYDPEHEEAAQWKEAAPDSGEAWVPLQRSAEPAQPQPTRPESATGQASAAQGMPTQRAGEADRAERSVAGPSAADQSGDDVIERLPGKQRVTAPAQEGSPSPPGLHGEHRACRRSPSPPWRA